MTSSELNRWAEVRGTSIEIAQAIEGASHGAVERMQELWEEPSEDEAVSIVATAFSNTSDDELYWGSESFSR